VPASLGTRGVCSTVPRETPCLVLRLRRKGHEVGGREGGEGEAGKLRGGEGTPEAGPSTPPWAVCAFVCPTGKLCNRPPVPAALCSALHCVAVPPPQVPAMAWPLTAGVAVALLALAARCPPWPPASSSKCSTPSPRTAHLPPQLPSRSQRVRPCALTPLCPHSPSALDSLP